MSLPDQFLLQVQKGRGLVRGFAPVYPNQQWEFTRTSGESDELLVKQTTREDGQSIDEAVTSVGYISTSAKSASGKTAASIIGEVQSTLLTIKSPESLPQLIDPKDEPNPQTVINLFSSDIDANLQSSGGGPSSWSNLRGPSTGDDEASLSASSELSALKKAKALLDELIAIPTK